MATVRWKRGEFRITAHPLTRTAFDEWIKDAGRSALRDELRRTRMRWFFGAGRAERRLYLSACRTFRPRGTFSRTMKRRLDRLPIAIRSVAIEIQKGGYRHLSTYDSVKFVAVVPRGVVQADFKQWLLKELFDLAQVRHFQGLTEQVVARVAAAAELAYFDHLIKTKYFVDENGRGMVMEADRDFKWRINGVDGHYLYALSLDEKTDLTNRRERRAFLALVSEVAKGQNVHLRRLRPEELNEAVDILNLRRTADGTIALRRGTPRREELVPAS